jgi:hypothetical protein
MGSATLSSQALLTNLPVIQMNLTQVEVSRFFTQDLNHLFFTPRSDAQLHQAEARIQGGYQTDPFVGLQNEPKQVNVWGGDDEVLLGTCFWLSLQGFPLLFRRSLWYQMILRKGKGAVLFSCVSIALR